MKNSKDSVNIITKLEKNMEYIYNQYISTSRNLVK